MSFAYPHNKVAKLPAQTDRQPFQTGQCMENSGRKHKRHKEKRNHLVLLTISKIPHIFINCFG